MRGLSEILAEIILIGLVVVAGTAFMLFVESQVSSSKVNIDAYRLQLLSNLRVSIVEETNDSVVLEIYYPSPLTVAVVGLDPATYEAYNVTGAYQLRELGDPLPLNLTPMTADSIYVYSQNPAYLPLSIVSHVESPINVVTVTVPATVEVQGVRPGAIMLGFVLDNKIYELTFLQG